MELSPSVSWKVNYIIADVRSETLLKWGKFLQKWENFIIHYIEINVRT
jgi:hypothetical protein